MEEELCHTLKSICDLSRKFRGNIQIVQEVSGKTGKRIYTDFLQFSTSNNAATLYFPLISSRKTVINELLPSLLDFVFIERRGVVCATH